MHSLTLIAIAAGACTLFSSSTFAGEKRASSKSASTAAAATSGAQLSALINSAAYSPADKDALIGGLRVAAPFGSTTALAAHVSQQTIDLQIKKSSSDLQRSIQLVFDVAKCIEQNRQEFLASPDFQRLPSSERSSVASHLEPIANEYSVRALETLFAANGRTINVPANVTRSASDADYQQVLFLTARVLQQSNGSLANTTPAKRVETAPPAETISAPDVAPAVEAAVAAPVAAVEAPISSPAPEIAAPAVKAEPAVAVAPVAAPAPEVTPTPVAPTTTPAAVAPALATETYTLKAGDSLAYVARLKKVSIPALLEANPGLAPNQMRVGQIISIPSAAPTATPPARREATGDKNTAMLTPRGTGQ